MFTPNIICSIVKTCRISSASGSLEKKVLYRLSGSVEPFENSFPFLCLRFNIILGTPNWFAAFLVSHFMICKCLKGSLHSFNGPGLPNCCSYIVARRRCQPTKEGLHFSVVELMIITIMKLNNHIKKLILTTG